MDFYPLAGGIGFGRIRISMVFRSVELQLAPELLGWDYGTLELKGAIKPKGTFPEDLQNDRMRARSNLAKGKYAAEEGKWVPKHGKESVFLACRNRYAMPLIIEYRKSSFGADTTPAFGVFWMKDIPDEEERSITIKIWKGGKENYKKATTCADYEGLEEGEQPLGEIEVTMYFWRGLSGYHKNYANKGKNADVRNVMEVLDTVNDEMEKDKSNVETDDDEHEDGSDSSDSDEDDAPNATVQPAKSGKLISHVNDDDSSSDSDDADSSTKNPIKKAKQKTKSLLNSHNESDDGSRGGRAQVKDYKDHRKQLHRKHRGIMQWKAARSADWMMGKVKRGTSKIGEAFEHTEKEQGVETEV